MHVAAFQGPRAGRRRLKRRDHSSPLFSRGVEKCVEQAGLSPTLGAAVCMRFDSSKRLRNDESGPQTGRHARARGSANRGDGLLWKTETKRKRPERGATGGKRTSPERRGLNTPQDNNGTERQWWRARNWGKRAQNRFGSELAGREERKKTRNQRKIWRLVSGSSRDSRSVRNVARRCTRRASRKTGEIAFSSPAFCLSGRYDRGRKNQGLSPVSKLPRRLFNNRMALVETAGT